MDSLIKRFDSERDGDLTLCEPRGVAYQDDMNKGRVSYDDAYLRKVAAYEGSEIAKAVNAGRVALLSRHLPPGASVLDYGAGSGEFLRAALDAKYAAKGFDVIARAVDKLQRANLYSAKPNGFNAVTLWDTIEHMPMPEILLRRIDRGAYLFVSIPVFDSLREIRASKHYRPGEHLYYWTRQGFIDWMAMYEYRLLEISEHEIEAGREKIEAFAFVRDLPGYHENTAAYIELHGQRHYGSSATELHLEDVARVVKVLKPRSIIDFGCGRGDLVAHFWLDGARKIARYDPAIPSFKEMPEGTFDLALCCDVMEHIPIAYVDRIFAEIQAKSGRVIFTISTKLARAKLPDGRNAHCTLLTRGEWLRWIAAVFGNAQELPSRWGHELIILAGAKVTSPEASPRCTCGGDAYLDCFDPIKRPKEYFMRCRECGGIGDVVSDPKAAENLWPVKNRKGL